MKFGVRDGVLRQGWEQTFGEAAWLGFDGVELDLAGNYADSLLWSEAGRVRLRQMQAGTGMDLAAICLGGLWEISPADQDAAIRQRAMEFIRGTIRHSRAVDCNVLLVPITPGNGSPPEQQSRYWMECLTRIAPLADAEGVCLAIENVGRGCAQSATAMLELIETVRSAAVRAYYDFGNGLGLGNDPAAEIALLGKRIRQLHAKDPGGTLLGQGKLPWRLVVDAVREIGYDGYIVLETDATDNPVDAATRNLQYLHEVFA